MLCDRARKRVPVRNYASRFARRGLKVQLYEGDRAKVMIINPGPGIIGRLNDALFHKIFPRDVAHARPRSSITNGCVSFPRDPEASNNVAALRISQPTASPNAGQGISRFQETHPFDSNSMLKIIANGCLFYNAWYALRISIFHCFRNESFLRLIWFPTSKNRVINYSKIDERICTTN